MGRSMTYTGWNVTAELVAASHRVQFGDPGLPPRFWSKVAPCPITGCWIWIASKFGRSGYAQFSVGRTKKHSGHRYAYEVLVGTIPPRLELDHLCRRRECVAPWHLEPVTHAENTLRGHTITALAAATTHCPSGHPYDDQNTDMRAGARVCRTCRRSRDLRRREKLNDSGLCMASADHGPAVFSRRCAACYEVHRQGMSRYRDRKRGA